MKDIVQKISGEIFFFFLLSFLLFPNSVQATSTNSYVLDDFTDRICTVSAPEINSYKVINSHFVLSLDCTENKQRSVHIPIQYNVDNQKLRVTISEINDHILGMGKFETDPSGQPIPSSYEHNYLAYQNNPVEFSLQNKHYDGLSFYFICRKSSPGTIGKVQIDKIEIIPKAFTDTRIFAYILAEIQLFLLILPGFLIYTLMQGRGNKINLLALLTPLSVFFFLFLYFILFINQKFSHFPLLDKWVLLICYLALNLLLFLWLKQKKEIGTLFANFRLIGWEMFALFIVTFVVTVIVVGDLELPLFTFTYNELFSRTYGAFGAHDPVFHYVNGIAILQEEPFSKYYENGKLFYGVQDRGIMAGVIYAVLRGIGSPINSAIANSYGFYTLFGSAFNILFLLPILGLHKYFFKDGERPLFIVFLVSASAFIITNYYITWFKLAAAGLVISGIVLLLVDKENIKQWLLTGVIWGIATNFHPSLALTYPVVTLWLLYRFFKAREYQFTSTIIAFLLLVGAFLAMNAPWTIIKSVHFPDTNVLFRQHFLDFEKYDPETGIVGSIKSFGNKYTIKEQVNRRLERGGKSFRVEEFVYLLKVFAKETWQRFLNIWSFLETSYIAFVFTPLVFLWFLLSCIKRLFPKAVNDYSPLTQRKEKEARVLMITQVLTVLLIIIGSFGPFSPDITWHLPMSCTAIIIYLLIQKIITFGRIGIIFLVTYSLFTYYRLFFPFF
ncbi:MAG: hypothetical protein CSA20_07475 [Deltaproteobacteria bacterium]|nr:MAG: hypothetical protein CSA20_07475 [Deltaproteobacteria bacterium]